MIGRCLQFLQIPQIIESSRGQIFELVPFKDSESAISNMSCQSLIGVVNMMDENEKKTQDCIEIIETEAGFF